MSLPTVTERVRRATAAIGKGSEFAGMCEKFTRGHFGFPARYGSAKLAYQASKRDGKVHVDYNAPAGVPVFWDILSGKNAPYDHVAISVGGGYCISTSAGPGGTVAKVSIRDLTQRWGMRYLGWAEFYHGQRVYTPKGSGGGTTPVPSYKYPNVEVGTGASELKSGWYQLLGALGYKGATWARVQSWLKASGDYTGRIDNDFGPLSVAALQRRLRNAYRKDNSGKLLDPGPADGLRGAKTKKAEAAYLNAHRWRAK